MLVLENRYKYFFLLLIGPFLIKYDKIGESNYVCRLDQSIFSNGCQKKIKLLTYTIYVIKTVTSFKRLVNVYAFVIFETYFNFLF